jgi:hypothetical protein
MADVAGYQQLRIVAFVGAEWLPRATADASPQSGGGRIDDILVGSSFALTAERACV